MNFIDKFFLWLVLLPVSLYRSLGVDTTQLRAILSAKLTMDNRRPASFGNHRRKKEKKEVNGATLKTIFGSLVMGLLMLFAFAVGNGMLTKLSLFMTMFIFMVCLTLITDFTSVLIDIRDNLIILPKPVSDATFMTARLLHIGIRTSIIVLPLSVPALVAATIMQGPLVILPFVLMILLMTLLSIFFINAVYLLILKITTPAKFQNIIGSIQIGFVMIVMLAYQVLPRMVNSSVMQHISISEIPFVRFVPSFWFADACMLLSGGGFSLGSAVSLVLSVIVPLLSIWGRSPVFCSFFQSKTGNDYWRYCRTECCHYETGYRCPCGSSRKIDLATSGPLGYKTRSRTCRISFFLQHDDPEPRFQDESVSFVWQHHNHLRSHAVSKSWV